jgi:hypothetical protein
LEAQQKVNQNQSRRFSGPPVTLGNMRELGVPRLIASCLLCLRGAHAQLIVARTRLIRILQP